MEQEKYSKNSLQFVLIHHRGLFFNDFATESFKPFLPPSAPKQNSGKLSYRSVVSHLLTAWSLLVSQSSSILHRKALVFTSSKSRFSAKLWH